jgi:hypothetical protein
LQSKIVPTIAAALAGHNLERCSFDTAKRFFNLEAKKPLG